MYSVRESRKLCGVNEDGNDLFGSTQWVTPRARFPYAKLVGSRQPKVFVRRMAVRQVSQLELPPFNCRHGNGTQQNPVYNVLHQSLGYRSGVRGLPAPTVLG